MRSTTALTREAPRLHRTLWYMGAKARVIPGFLDRVLEKEVPRGGTVVDLMSGTGIVAAFCAGRYRVFANDVQEYANVIARSLIEHNPDEKESFLASVNPRRDLEKAYRKSSMELSERYAPALEAEAALLERFAAGEDDASWAEDYRSYLETPGAVYAGFARSNSAPRARGLYAGAHRLIGEDSLAAYRRDPSKRPACLATVYYANIYFGLRQAIAIDSVRAAIDDLSPRSSQASLKRVHYLSALLHAASVSTSGTSHFAQPRHLTKDSELRAMAKRRQIDVFACLEEWSSEILATVRETAHVPGNKCLGGDYRRLLEGNGSGSRFHLPSDVDLIYLDPPYTMDNYSRFYHVLEAIARYDYPPLELDVAGEVVRGRYPQLEGRFLSGFCSKQKVEDEFRRVIHAAARSGAKLVISYASPTGLLLKQYAKKSAKRDPVKQLEDLCRESYADVHTERRSMMHSGQGEKSRRIEELLVVCTGPRG